MDVITYRCWDLIFYPVVVESLNHILHIEIMMALQTGSFVNIDRCMGNIGIGNAFLTRRHQAVNCNDIDPILLELVASSPVQLHRDYDILVKIIIWN